MEPYDVGQPESESRYRELPLPPSRPSQRTAQIYETTILDERSNNAALCVSIPTSAVLNDFGFLDVAGVAERLDLKIAAIVRPGHLIPALGACLAGTPPERIVELSRERSQPQPSQFAPQEFLDFAEYIVLARLIPFAESPLGIASLGSIIATGSGGAIGAFVGIAVVGAATPLLFVTVPAGIILCGAAMGVAEGLQEGLKARMARWATGKPPPPRPPDPE